MEEIAREVRFRDDVARHDKRAARCDGIHNVLVTAPGELKVAVERDRRIRAHRDLRGVGDARERDIAREGDDARAHRRGAEYLVRGCARHGDRGRGGNRAEVDVLPVGRHNAVLPVRGGVEVAVHARTAPHAVARLAVERRPDFKVDHLVAGGGDGVRRAACRALRERIVCAIAIASQCLRVEERANAEFVIHGRVRRSPCVPREENLAAVPVFALVEDAVRLESAISVA